MNLLSSMQMTNIEVKSVCLMVFFKPSLCSNYDKAMCHDKFDLMYSTIKQKPLAGGWTDMACYRRGAEYLLSTSNSQKHHSAVILLWQTKIKQ